MNRLHALLTVKVNADWVSSKGINFLFWFVQFSDNRNLGLFVHASSHQMKKEIQIPSLDGCV